MRALRPLLSIALVLLAAALGTVGTGLIYRAFADGSWVALVMGLPLALFGLYWCGGALAQSHRYTRRTRAH